MSAARKSPKAKTSERPEQKRKNGRSNPFPFDAVAFAFTVGATTLLLTKSSDPDAPFPVSGGLAAADEFADKVARPTFQSMIPFGATLAVVTQQFAKLVTDKSPETAVFVVYLVARLQRGKMKGIGPKEHKELWEEVWQTARNKKAVAAHRATIPRDGSYARWKERTEKSTRSKFNRLIRSTSKMRAKASKIEGQLGEWLS